ncbi:MAG: cupin domain-containing protein, partial [Gammaproteobacteria bacterium]|nr:cupin domain-containing protein [Gammaproteobacteria bacterium]
MSETASPPAFEDNAGHHAPIIRRPADHPGLAGRFGNVTRMVFHPTPEHPNEPNAGLITYRPGAGFPRHMHDFAQLWYVLEGECRFGDRRLRAGDMVYMEDPHFEHEMRTETGCTIVF